MHRQKLRSSLVALALVGGVALACATKGDRHGSVMADQSGPGQSPALAANACAPPSMHADYQDPLVHRGRAEGDTFIEILDVHQRGQLVYSCTATRGLTIWDVQNPEDAKLLSERTGPKGISHRRFPRCQHLALKGDGPLAAITNRGDEIQKTPFVHLYDLSDPKAPKALGGWQGPESIEGVAFWGDKLIAAAHQAGILVFERGADNALTVTSRFADGDSNAWAPLVRGDLLYVAEGHRGLRVYQLADSGPSLVGQVKLQGTSKALIAHGDQLVVATSYGFAVLDLSDPRAPKLKSEVETPGTAIDLAMGPESLVFVADWDEVHAYDISQPEAPKLRLSKTVPTDGEFSRVLALDANEQGMVYAGEWRGLQLLEYQAKARGPEIAVRPAKLQYGSPDPDSENSRTVTVYNTGDRPLRVAAVTPSTPSLVADSRCFEIPAQESRDIELSYQPHHGEPVRATLNLSSDDVDEPELVIPVTGSLGGLSIGDQAPDFELMDLEGKRWSKAELRGKVVLLSYFATF